jgi:hypothetical protein
MDIRHLSPEQYALLFDAARRQAHALRQQAIADFFARAAAWLERLVGPGRDTTEGKPCRS